MDMTGQCLCGSVTLRASGVVPEASACHCGMCRRWNGTAYWGVVAATVEAALLAVALRNAGLAHAIVAVVAVGAHTTHPTTSIITTVFAVALGNAARRQKLW